MSIKRTIITTLVALALVAVVAPVAVNAQAMTIAQLEASIAQLTAELNGLGGTTTSTPAVTTGACAGVTFTRNLTVGSTGSDVKCLQVILNQNLTTQVAVIGAGSPGMETSTFGPKTLVSVRKYQVVNGLTPASQVGPLTRAKLNAALGGLVTTTPVNTTLPAGCTSTSGFSPTTGASCATGVVIVNTGSISATLASDNPTSGAVVNNEARAGLLNINFTGTGTVTSLTLQRSGISTSNTLSSVYLYDGSTRITSGYSFNTNGQLVMNGLNIAVNGSHEISVVADVYSLATNDSSSIAVGLVGYTANGTTSSANVMGNTMTVVTGSAATAYFTSGGGVPTQTSTATINPGSTNQTLWSQNISISPRAVMLYGMTVKQIGSAPSNTLANVGLYVDGTLAATATINSNNQFVFTVSNPVTLSTGSHLIEIHGDVVGGATRSFYLSLEQGSDVAIKDSQLGIYIAANETNTTTPAYNINGETVTLGGVSSTTGNITINQDPAFSNTTTLVGGTANTTLASFTITAYGEDTKVTSLTLNPVISGSDGTHNLNTLANVGLYLNGGQIGSNTTATSGVPMTSFNNLGSQLLIPAGTTVTVSIKGDVIAAATDLYGANNNYKSGSVQFTITGFNTQGVTSGQTYTTTAASIGGQQLTVSSTNVTFVSASGFAGSTVTPNSTVELGAWTLQTGSAEGVNVNNVVVTFPDDTTNTLVHNNQLSNLTLKVNGSTLSNVSTIGQPVVTSANNFSVSIPVAVNGSTEIELYGTIGSSSTAYTVTPSMSITYRGTTSNLTTTSNAIAGVASSSGAAAIASAGITTSTSLTQQFVTGNPAGSASPVGIATFNVKSTGNVGGATIRDITFKAAGTTAGTGTIASVTVNGVTRSFSLASGAYTATVPSVGIAVPANYSGVNIPVTVQLACIGSGCAAQANNPVQLSIVELTYNNGSSVVCDGAGAGAVTACTATGTNDPSAISATMSNSYLVSTVPTISLTSSSVSGALTHGEQQIGTFTIAAGNTGDIKVEAIPFTITLSTAGTASITAGSVHLYDANGNALDVVPSNNNLSGSGTFTFAAPYKTITQSTSVTYSVYADIEGTFGTAGQTSVTFGLGDKGSFAWGDITGNVSPIAGTYINSYPNGTQSKTN
jgi:hypothetical protein